MGAVGAMLCSEAVAERDELTPNLFPCFHSLPINIEVFWFDGQLPVHLPAVEGFHRRRSWTRRRVEDPTRAPPGHSSRTRPDLGKTLQL